MTAGYSETPLAKKLNLRDGQRCWFEHMPESVIDEIDEEKGIARLSYWSKLDPEKHKAFLGRLEESLKGDYSKKDLTYILGVWAKMQMDREGWYVLDLESGLPIEGRIASSQAFEGKTSEEVIEFTTTY